MKSKVSASFWIVVSISVLLAVFRLNNVSQKELSWDIFGYYLPLPATFIYDDPLLKDRSWVEDVNKKYELTDTLYQISSTPNGEPMYFFLFGMSYIFLIFFGMGHMVAGWLGYPQDGFSEPYQYSLIIGGIIFTIIGLFYLRKILRYFFDEKVSSVILVLIVFATNYVHHMSVKDLETVNFLFTLLTIMLWNTILWHENQRFKHLIGMAIPLGLMALVKPSEILLVLVPLLWQTGTLEAIKDKWNKIKAAKWQILISILIVFVIALPQLFYWHTKTGLWIYDSYKNPGVGLDIFNPHIIESLFSYRKGWLVYTPVMIFFLAGFYFLFRSDKKLFTGLLIPFLVSFYVLSSWTEWWYGAGFSNRPVITYYPLLAIPFGFLLNELFRSGELIKGAVFMAFSFCMFLNLFQWWQMQHYILDPYRTTKDYYWATFLKTHVEEKDRDLLLVERSFSGVDTFKKEKAYSKKQLSYNNFNNDSPGVKIISPEMEFDLTNTIQYKELSSKDHVWLRFKFVYAFPDTTNSGKVIFCSTMDRKEGNYGYKTFEIDPQNAKNGTVQFDFLTPEIRDPKDLLKYYFWNRDHNKIYIDDFKVEVFEKK